MRSRLGVGVSSQWVLDQFGGCVRPTSYTRVVEITIILSRLVGDPKKVYILYQPKLLDMVLLVLWKRTFGESSGRGGR